MIAGLKEAQLNLNGSLKASSMYQVNVLQYTCNAVLKPICCHCAVNCLDRHDGSKIALLWEPPNQEPEQLTYRSESEVMT